MNKTDTKIKTSGIILDELLESLGALVTCLLILLDKGKHPMIRDVHNMQDTDCPVKKESIR